MWEVVELESRFIARALYLFNAIGTLSHAGTMVELEGFEPSTFPMESGRSLQAGAMVELEGFEPSTSSMPLKRSPN